MSDADDIQRDLDESLALEATQARFYRSMVDVYVAAGFSEDQAMQFAIVKCSALELSLGE